LPSLIKGRPSTTNNNNNNNKAKCIPGGTLRVLAGKNGKNLLLQTKILKLLHGPIFAILWEKYFFPQKRHHIDYN
jgi:hypothetical protein